MVDWIFSGIVADGVGGVVQEDDPMDGGHRMYS